MGGLIPLRVVLRRPLPSSLRRGFPSPSLCLPLAICPRLVEFRDRRARVVDLLYLILGGVSVWIAGSAWSRTDGSMGTDHVHAIGSPVWVLTAEDTWLKGTVTKLHDSTVEVTVKQEDGQEVKIKSEKCPLRNVGRPVEVCNQSGIWRNLRAPFQSLLGRGMGMGLGFLGHL